MILRLILFILSLHDIVDLDQCGAIKRVLFDHLGDHLGKFLILSDFLKFLLG